MSKPEATDPSSEPRCEFMSPTNASGRGPQMTEEEAIELENARARMIARHKLIEQIIYNNEMQLRNESARGGAEIERECALRDMDAEGGTIEKQELERITAKLAELDHERTRLIAEREWLNASLLEFESGPSAQEHKRAGHA
jgi:hypothetical protein